MADPAANAEAILHQVRRPARRRASRSPSSPSSACRATPSTTSSCRTSCSTRSTPRSCSSPRPPPGCAPSSSSARRCVTATGSTTAPSSSRAARSSASRRSPPCPTTASSTRSGGSPPGTSAGRAPARPRTGPVPTRTATSPSAPTSSSRPSTCPGLAVHVEVCEDMWVPVPPSARAALPGATVLLNLVGLPHHRRARRGPAPARPLRERALQRGLPVCRRLQRGVHHRPVVGRHDDGLRDGRPARRDRAVPARTAGDRRRRRPRPAAPGAHAAGLLRRQPARLDARPADGNPSGSEFDAQPAAGDIGLRRKVDRFPFVPDDEERLALDCYEAYNIQVSGLEQRLRAMPPTAAAEDRHRRQRRARLHPRAHRRRQGDGPARPPAHRHHRLHDARLRDQRGHQEQRHPPHGVARHHLGGARHPAGRHPDAQGPRPPVRPTARRSTTSPSRTSRPACAPTTSSAPPTSAAASSSAPATCPSWRSAGAPTASATRCRTTASTAASRRR